MPEQSPSVGRIVHYVSYGTPGGEYTRQCRAAIVTEVHQGTESDRRAGLVSLAVLNPEGMFFNRECRQHEADGGGQVSAASHPGGTWHWPESV
ncbi:hypothetical protein QBA54_32040 [Streptomyces sp. B21-108]|uniref:hypothetical protein n=1 Tax=Streptomyces sp. B21-108 TaxID=3039419 RepID=UPI002FF02911